MKKLLLSLLLLVLAGTSFAQSPSSSYSVPSLAALKALTTRPPFVETTGYYSAGDGGAGPQWAWYANDASTADDCSVVTPTSGPAGRYKRDLSVWSDPRWCGARGTAGIAINKTASITSGAAILTVVGDTFAATDVGKQIRVPGAGTAGGVLSTTIAGYTSPTQITLTANAATTLAAATNKTIIFGYDDTTAIQAAMTASKRVTLSCGTYFVTASLEIGANRALVGERMDCTYLVRTDAYSHTVKSPAATAAGGVEISNIYFLEPQYFVTGMTTLPFATAANAAHIYLEGAQGANICNNRFLYMPYGIRLVGSTLSKVCDNFSEMIWDPNVAALQEGNAIISLEYSTTLVAHTKNIQIVNNRSLGGINTTGGSVNIATTCGSIAVTIADRAIGPKHAIWAKDGEELLISGNYFGVQSSHSVYLNLTTNSILLGIRITENFFDATAHTSYSVYADAGIADIINFVTIANNDFNGQYRGLGAVYVADNAASPSLYSLVLEGNNMLAFLTTPVQLNGAKGVVATGNKIKSYNETTAGGAVCTADPQAASAIYVGGSSAQITTGLNQFGGGNLGETATPPNQTAWGLYSSITTSSTRDTGIGLITATYGGSAAEAATTIGGTTCTLGSSCTLTSVNGLGITASTGTLTIANGKTLTASNTLTFAGTDGSTLNVGTGGTLGTAAYQSTGTSGATIPFLNGANTWGAAQTFVSSIALSTAAVAPASMGIYNGSGTTFTHVGGSSGYAWNNAANNATLMSLSNAGALAISNTLNSVSPTAPNRTITMVVGGVTVYLHAKTTND